MALKTKDIQKMNKEEKDKKLKELKLELIKSRTASQKNKTKEIKKLIARILTTNK